MTFGVTATTALAYAAAASAVIGVIGSIQQGNQAEAAAESQANMDEYNAKKADQQAEHANRMAGIKEDDQRRRLRAAVGNQIASSAEAGAGLNSDLIRQSLYDGEMDTAAIRYEGALQADGYSSSAAMSRSNAEISRRQGKSAVTASYLNAAGSLVGAASSYYGSKIKR
jgi:hypothetical protein